jgi:hypothetical protein
MAGATTAGAALLRHGYSYRTGDQGLLALKGVALADPTAYRNDWFTDSSPSPHWLFDGITFLGERAGILPLLYLAYWLLAMFLFGFAATWLGHRFLPEHRWAPLFLGPVVVAGPELILGSTTPILGVALPHVLGGCLAFFTLAALITGRQRWAVVGALAAGAVHVQHGASLAPVLVLAALLCRLPRRQRMEYAFTGVALAVMSVAVVQWRHLDTAGDEWLTVCRDFIPYHCEASRWSPLFLLQGLILLIPAVVWACRRGGTRRLALCAVGLPSAGLTLGVLVDRFDVPIVGSLAQQANVYRLVTLVVPFTAMALITLACSLTGRQVGRTTVFAALSIVWIASPGWQTRGLAGLDEILSLAALTTCGVLLGLRLRDVLTTELAMPRRALAAVPILVIVAFIAREGIPAMALQDPGSPVSAAASAIGRALPAGSVLAAPPSLELRPRLERAVVADCKGVPYGGELVRDYLDRLDALGGRDCDPTPDGFGSLSVAELQALQDRFGATHVLLLATDPKREHAEMWWPKVWAATPASPRAIQGWAVFELQR